MYEHNLKNFMKLAEVNEGIINTDQYYQRTYEKIAAGKCVTWNWAPLFLGIGWLFYRKMYGIAFLWILLVFVFQNAVNASLKFTVLKKISLVAYFHIGISMESIIFLLCFFSLPLFGNKLYVRHIHNKIKKGYHLCNLKNIDSFSCWLWFLSCNFGMTMPFYFEMLVPMASGLIFPLIFIIRYPLNFGFSVPLCCFHIIPLYDFGKILALARGGWVSLCDQVKVELMLASKKH